MPILLPLPEKPLAGKWAEPYSPQGQLDCSKSAQGEGLTSTHWPREGGLNSKFHAVCDGIGGPIILLLTEGQMRAARQPAIAKPCTRNAIGSKTTSSRSSKTGIVPSSLDRCAHTFFSAICIAATMIFWVDK